MNPENKDNEAPLDPENRTTYYPANTEKNQNFNLTLDVKSKKVNDAEKLAEQLDLQLRDVSEAEGKRIVQAKLANHLPGKNTTNNEQNCNASGKGTPIPPYPHQNLSYAPAQTPGFSKHDESNQQFHIDCKKNVDYNAPCPVSVNIAAGITSYIQTRSNEKLGQTAKNNDQKETPKLWHSYHHQQNSEITQPNNVRAVYQKFISSYSFPSYNQKPLHRGYSSTLFSEKSAYYGNVEQKKISTFEQQQLQQRAFPRSSEHEVFLNQDQNVFRQNDSRMKENPKQITFQKSDKKYLNILILGESGVGKSTWINSFANYLNFTNLEEAINNEIPVYMIPTKFSMYDINYKSHVISLGNNERPTTQNANIYEFEKDDYVIRIIDTPALNDTRWNTQDDTNIQKILGAVGPFKELHAICFLIRANESRLTQSFKYCISKLLGNLSKSALNNTCFVFTHTRGTFFKPGDTMVPLKAYFKELQQKEGLSIPINDANTFCLDNEAFRFICAYFKRIQFSELELETYSESWKHSSNEINRLLNYAAKLHPHNITETVSINETRTWISQLVNPTITVFNLIEMNLHILKEHIQEIKLVQTIQELINKSAVTLNNIIFEELKEPQIICNSEKCVKYNIYEGNAVFKKVICYKTCRSNDCFTNDGRCRKCGCLENEHQRVIYEEKIVTKPHKIILQAITSENEGIRVREGMIRYFEEFFMTHENELNFVMDSMAAFSCFLFKNGINQGYDAFEKHIIKLLEKEQKTAIAVSNYEGERYHRLVQLLEHYRNIHQNILNNYYNSNLSLAGIKDIRQQLFEQPIMGKKILQLFNIYVKANGVKDYAHHIIRFDKNKFCKRFEKQ